MLIPGVAPRPCRSRDAAIPRLPANGKRAIVKPFDVRHETRVSRGVRGHTKTPITDGPTATDRTIQSCGTGCLLRWPVSVKLDG